MKESVGLTKKPIPLALYLSWVLVIMLMLPGLTRTGQASTPADIVVNSTQDIKKTNDGLCTLREAIIAANSDKPSGSKPGECRAGSGADTIILPLGTYTLSRTDNGNEDAAATGDLDVLDDVKIEGAGPGQTIIDASGIADRAFQILGGSVELTGITIRNTRPGTGDGAGVHNSSTLVLRECTIENTVTSAHGGGIYNAGDLTLLDTTVSGNTASVGGGINNTSSGAVILDNSTLTGNTATSGAGGGIFNRGLLALSNGTIADNPGGAIANADDSGTVNLRNTILAGDGPDCSGTLSSQGYNLSSDSSCGLSEPGDIINAEPLLGPLQDNGGATATRAILNGSPAIDAGDPEGCFGSQDLLREDQRGEPRPMDGDHNRDFRCDIGAFEVGESILVLTRARPDGRIDGRISSAANTLFALKFFASDSCPTGYGPVDDAIVLAPAPDPDQSIQAETDGYGNVYFTATVTPPALTFVYGQATILNGSTRDFSQCVPVSAGNTSWPNALSLDQETPYPPHATYEQYIDKLGQSRWYKFSVQPDGQVVVTLTGRDGGPLPANYDLTVYKDIAATFFDLTAPQDSSDLVLLGAEFAGDAFSGDAFSGDAFSGDAFSGDAFSGDAFSGDAFSGDAFSGDAFSGDAFSGDAFSGDAFSPDEYSGDAFSGDAFSGDAFSGDAFSGDAFSGDAYNAVFSSAQTRSLLGVSAFEGTASEGIRVNTWNNAGEFYVRVRGRNGAYSLDAPFRLTVTFAPGACGDVTALPDMPPIGTEGDNPKTLILYDSSRMNRIDGSDQINLVTQLANLALHPEVEGKLVDLGLDSRVAFAHSQADAYPTCPYAKNLVVQAIKDIIDGYRIQPGSNVEYVVLVGGDEIIPFARVPDDALLANEKNFYPPVRDDTASQASLRRGYVLTQDVYGSRFDTSLNNSVFPVLELAVGRLVETAAEINAMIDAFLRSDGNGDGVPDGVVKPQTSLATGYDFLWDAATAIQVELRDGINGDDTTSQALIVPGGGPADPNAWTADDLRAKLLPGSGAGPDIVFLAGHFTGNSALAADYDTRLLASEIAESSVDLADSVIFSIGCHAGYNIVNQHDIPHVTREPDWAQAFARHGATLIAGTGYQYGDTDLLKYSEELYLEFSRQLRLQSAPNPVSIGEALVRAKKAYLIRTPHIGGLDEKALLEATIFGLPMLKVDLVRNYVPTEPPTVPELNLTPFTTNPGLELGLAYYDGLKVMTPQPLIEHERILRDVTTGLLLDEPVSYLEGFNGHDANPGEPILPLEVRDVSVPGAVLRGVGFRGGLFTDIDVLPLISSATTENSGVHTPFLTDFLYPVQPWRVNYFDALGGGDTLLMVTPAQHRTSLVFSDPQKSTRRQFSEMTFRLYYSSNTDTFTGDPDHPSTPAGSAPPAIVSTWDKVTDSDVTFGATVVGNPSAGIQEVWVTYGPCEPPGPTREGGWQSLDLVQSRANSTVWEVTVPLASLGPAADNVCYMVQTVNGVGLVSRADNLGLFYRVGADAEQTEATSLEFQSPAPNSSGPFGTKATFSARLTDENAESLAGEIVTFRLGAQTRRAMTDENGICQVSLALIAEPGNTELKASFAGASPYKPSDATLSFNIVEQGTYLVLEPDPAVGRADAAKLMTATLKTVDERPLFQKTVIFEVTGAGGTYTEAVVTTFTGRAYLGDVPLPRGEYTVRASFDDPLITGAKDDPLYTASSVSGSLTLLNNPPVAVNDTFTLDTFELTIVAPGVLENDSDRDGDATTAILFAPPTLGTLTLNPDGSFTYLPTADFDSLDDTDTFTYKANDGFDDSDEEATATIVPSVCFTAKAVVVGDPEAPSIWPPNGEPVEVDLTIDPPASLVVTGIFQDEPVAGGEPDGQFIDADTVLVRSARDGNGNGRVYHILFNADDGQGDTCSGDVRVPVVSHDQSGDVGDFDEGALYDSTVITKFAPVANPDSASTDEDTAVAGNVLDNDSDQNPQDVLTIMAVNADRELVGIEFALASGALLTVNLDGSFQYEPNGQFEFLGAGDFATDTFDYTVSDGDGGTDTAVVTIGIAGTNDPPQADSQEATTNQDMPMDITLTGSDPDDEDLTFSVLSGPFEGSLSGTPPNLTYTPGATFYGSDSFTFRVNDGQVDSALAVVAIRVNAVPLAEPQQVETGEDTPVGITLTGFDPDGEDLTFSVVSGPEHGSLSGTAPNLTYTPLPDYSGSDSFTFKANDGRADSEAAKVNITVQPTNDPPVASAQAVTTAKDAPVSVTLSGFDPDGDDLDFLVASGPEHGSLSGTAPNLTYAPSPGYTGPDRFTFTVSDGQADSEPATVSITVQPTNRPPDAVDDRAVTAPQGAPVTIDVLENDSDPDGDPLAVIGISQPTRGTVQPNADGTLTYIPNSSYKGTDTFSYTISDGRGGTDTAMVTVTFGKP